MIFIEIIYDQSSCYSGGFWRAVKLFHLIRNRDYGPHIIHHRLLKIFSLTKWKFLSIHIIVIRCPSAVGGGTNIICKNVLKRSKLINILLWILLMTHWFIVGAPVHGSRLCVCHLLCSLESDEYLFRLRETLHLAVRFLRNYAEMEMLTTSTVERSSWKRSLNAINTCKSSSCT